jgi:hypothetical protein
MFTYRLHSPEGDDLGEATYPERIKVGEGCSSALVDAPVCSIASRGRPLNRAID